MSVTQHFDNIADLLPEPTLLVARSGEILCSNLSFVRQFGHPQRSLTGCSLADLVNMADGELDGYLKHCASSRQFVFGACSIRCQDGTVVPCKSEGAVHTPGTAEQPALLLLRFLPKHQSIARFLSLTHKIDELSLEIKRRKYAERELRSQRELLQVTLRSIGDAVITTGVDGCITFMNDIAESLTGWTLTEALGRHVDDVFRIVNEATRTPVDSPINHVLQTGKVVGLANHTVLLSRDGSERPIDDSGAPIIDDRGRLHGVVLVFRDVTQVRKAERDQLAARAAAEAANVAKDHFLATLSHELRTPLNAIVGWTRMLIDGTVEPARRNYGLSVIERNAALQARLIEDLLDVSRITARKLEMRSDVVQIGDIVKAAADAIEPLALEKGVTLKTMFGTLPDTLGDAARIEQALRNLLLNAVKFTPTDGQVTVRAVQVASVIQIIVEDSGIGFDPALSHTLFEAFSQVDVSFSRPHGGLGLGLTIAKGLIEAHGGTIVATSAGIGQGARFEVTLPLRQ